MSKQEDTVNLLTQENRNALPKIGAQDGKDAVAYVKWFTPDSSWTWYVTEFDGNDECFGLVQGLEEELGYFSLSEIAEARGPMGLKVERDFSFKPTPISKLRRSN